MTITGIIIALIVILCLFFGIFGRSPFTKPAQPITNNNSVKNIQNNTPPEKVTLGLPVRIKIPKVNINATVEHIGVTPQGALDLPKGNVNAAWYNLGPRPWDIGSAVITGHYGVRKDGTPTVFNDLHKLEKGDKIYVEDDKWSSVSFIVRESRKYDPNADTMDIFGSNDEKSHLNIITCQGIWDKIKKNYPNRLVIFSDREEK